MWLSAQSRLFLLALLPPLGMACLEGCSWFRPDRKNVTLHGDPPAVPITIGELEGELRYLADRYAMGVAEACDRLRRQVSEEDLRRELLHFKLKNATSAYDFVTSGHAVEELLDLLTLIELQNIVWLDENRIGRYSKYSASEALAATLANSRKEAWALAERALDHKQLEEVREAHREWRRQNPDLEDMSFVRFSTGAGTVGATLVHELHSELGSFLDPFSSATESVDQTRDLAAKAFFFAKRLPTLAEWEAEAAAMGVADLPAIRRLQQNSSSLARSVADWPSEGRSMILTACAGLAGVVAIGFFLLGLYKRLSSSWTRTPSPAPPQRPPTRLHPQP